jgi:hypothetical protein
MKPYVKIEIKLTYVDPNKWFGKQKHLGNNTIITTVKELPLISEKLSKLVNDHGIKVYEDQPALPETKND